ncbi:hypothetical protein Leryth_011787 [Lithospermum erythrorhizon]|nr:hypothetical protein Leryth_011787 [Lithospermum erythrorhizon]
MATVENNNTSSRQAARRRRIIERGNDRLALITGRIQSLPPPTQSDQFPSATCPLLLLILTY